MNEVNRCKDCAFYKWNDYTNTAACEHPTVNRDNIGWLASSHGGMPCIVARGGFAKEPANLWQYLSRRRACKTARQACGPEGKLFLPRDVAELCEDKKQQPLRAGPVAMPGVVTSRASALYGLMQNTARR